MRHRMKCNKENKMII